MAEETKTKEESKDPAKDKQQRDAERIETNKSDPQLTELKGFVDPAEPLEEEGTLNPFTGNPKEGE